MLDQSCFTQMIQYELKPLLVHGSSWQGPILVTGGIYVHLPRASLSESYSCRLTLASISKTGFQALPLNESFGPGQSHCYSLHCLHMKLGIKPYSTPKPHNLDVITYTSFHVAKNS